MNKHLASTISRIRTGHAVYLYKIGHRSSPTCRTCLLNDDYKHIIMEYLHPNETYYSMNCTVSFLLLFIFNKLFFQITPRF
ncbi:hypothetical protein O3M35_008811 [Rhynocoris fuscipes]|uniref:Uncharacterized protein n=1 Tax=Rhynocoris fuscipes TaxID=488301 RepID=A0AAW1D939_9HEMI